jgi:hypothetical protein
MIFVTIQSVLREAMKVKGRNKFKIPHMQKEKLERERGSAPIANLL